MRPRAVPSAAAPVALRVVGTAIAAAAALPVFYLLWRAVSSGPTAYGDAVSRSATFELVATTVALAICVTLLAVLIALPLAWLVVRTDLVGRRGWALAAALPLVFPSYVSALAFVATLGPNGTLQQWLAPLGLLRLPEIALGLSGATLALALFTYPYLYLPLIVALRNLDPAIEDSARSLGCGPWRSFFQVVLPQLRSPLATGGALIALYAVSDFGAVSLTRCNTLTLGVYNAYRSLFDRSVAAAMGTVLVGVALLLIALQAAMLHAAQPQRAHLRRPPRRVRLGVWQWPCTLALVALHALTLGVPLAVVGYWGVRAILVGNVLGDPWPAAWNSVALSAGAAFAALFAALPLALWSVRFPSRLSLWSARVAQLGQALPGLIVALAFVFLATRRFPGLYQTTPLLVAAYAVRFLPQALAATRDGLSDVPTVVEQAARSLGSGSWTTWVRVTLPIMRHSLLVALGMVFLTTMKELPATLILRPIGVETLATRVWSAASEQIYSEAALPALLLVLVSAPCMYLLAIRPVLSRGGDR